MDPFRFRKVPLGRRNLIRVSLLRTVLFTLVLPDLGFGNFTPAVYHQETISYTQLTKRWRKQSIPFTNHGPALHDTVLLQHISTALCSAWMNRRCSSVFPVNGMFRIDIVLSRVLLRSTRTSIPRADCDGRALHSISERERERLSRAAVLVPWVSPVSHRDIVRCDVAFPRQILCLLCGICYSTAVSNIRLHTTLGFPVVGKTSEGGWISMTEADIRNALLPPSHSHALISS